MKGLYHMRNRMGMISVLVGLGTILTFMPEVASATQGLGQIGQNLGNNVTGIAYFLKMLAWLVGFGALMGGIIMFMTRHKTQTPMGVIIGMILGGILLLSIMTFASSGSSTVFGYDATTSAQAALGN